MEGRGVIALGILVFTILITIGCVISFIGVSVGGTASDLAGVTVGLGRLGALVLVAVAFISIILIVIGRKDDV